MNKILIVLAIGLTSCGTTRSAGEFEISFISNIQDAKLDYEMEKLWIEYNYKVDTLLNSYYENKAAIQGANSNKDKGKK